MPKVFALCGIALIACQSGGLAHPTTPSGQGPAQTISNPNPTAGTTDTPAGADPQKLAEVQAEVADNNAKEAADVTAFSSNGWAIVDTQTPDLALVAFDPALLAAGRESDLRMQLASTTPKAVDVGNILTIAQQTQNDDVRSQAVRALGHIDSAAAQRALLTLATTFPPEVEARQYALASLRPVSVSDPFTSEIAQLVSDARLSDSEQDQIAFTLALLQARDTATVTGLPSAAQVKVDAMASLLRGAQ